MGFISERQAQTTATIREKANLIWETATHLVGLFKPHEYGKVILPMTVLKRFDEVLKPTKETVVARAEALQDKELTDFARDGLLKKAAGFDFYNTSRFDFKKLLAEPEAIEANFEDYLRGFSPNIKDIIDNFNFEDTVRRMVRGGVLFVTIQEFNSPKADMDPARITSTDMGYVFEELIRKFSESYDEQAGAHFTSRDIIYLMTDLLIEPEREHMRSLACSKTAYDKAMGTSQMLGCLHERLLQLNPQSDMMAFGQEFNPETYAIARADMLIKNGNVSGMKFGDTLADDQFPKSHFDYIISNPPFGIDWKRVRKEVEDEAALGELGRFSPGLPAVGDGQMLFLLNGVKKLKPEGGRMAIIQNGSSLFTGDAGSGASEIRRHIIEGDMLEAVIQLPTDLFYNTGIATYIWLVTKDKAPARRGLVQLIDASACFVKRRKNIGNKRVDIDDSCISLILQAYRECKDAAYAQGDLTVESKVKPNSFFGFTKVTVETAKTDAKGRPVLDKKGNRQPVKGGSDTETIPLGTDMDAYMAENVLPYNPAAYIDHAKDKTGYEIPFTRIFYKFTPPTPSATILQELNDLAAEEARLMQQIFHDHA